MPKDYANIYTLSETERKTEIKDLWKDSIPGTEELAQNILKKIEDDEYPYVLSVEAGYGMGKTHFFSRFCEYAIKHGFDCVYMSAWENDYQTTPFSFLCENIKKFMMQKDSLTVKSKLSDFIDSSKSLLIKLGQNIDVNIGIKHIFQITVKNLYKLHRKEETDVIKDFKKQLTELIVATQTKPLILIIDELDRCRPDYALKTLETIKHFFDVDNLYIILPINKEAINYAVSSIYGDKNGNSENYLKKLITQNLIMPSPKEEHYQKIIKTIITETKLKRQIQKEYIEKNNNYNGLNIIPEYIGKYAYEGKLTYRETVQVCNEFLTTIKQFKEKVHIEYLAYLICKKYKHQEINLNPKHPFNSTTSQVHAGKYQALTINNLYSTTHYIVMRIPSNNPWTTLHNEMNILTHDDHFTSYEELLHYLTKIEDAKQNIMKLQWREDISDELNHLYDLLKQGRKQMEEYQRQYGSSDEDPENKKFYDDLMNNPLSLYSK